MMQVGLRYGYAYSRQAVKRPSPVFGEVSQAQAEGAPVLYVHLEGKRGDIQGRQILPGNSGRITVQERSGELVVPVRNGVWPLERLELKPRAEVENYEIQYSL